MMNELCIITAVKQNKQWTKRSLLIAPNHVNKLQPRAQNEKQKSHD